MSIQRGELKENKESMCNSCMLFYASEANKGLCSSCFKYSLFLFRKNTIDKKEETQIKEFDVERTEEFPCRKDTLDTLEEVKLEPVQKDKKRCFDCNKKTGLLGIECKCGFVFCNSHRLPENHHCCFDFAQDGKKKLEKEIFKVYNGKIADI